MGSVIFVNERRCTGCSLCVPFCSAGALTCLGWAKVSEDCTGCLSCLPFCPNLALEEVRTEEGSDARPPV